MVPKRASEKGVRRCTRLGRCEPSSWRRRIAASTERRVVVIGVRPEADLEAALGNGRRDQLVAGFEAAGRIREHQTSAERSHVRMSTLTHERIMSRSGRRK